MSTKTVKAPAPIKTINKYFKDHVNISESISLGKTYKYSIDKSFIKPYLNGDRFIFQTPMLYMPYAAKHVDSYNSGGIGFDNWHLMHRFIIPKMTRIYQNLKHGSKHSNTIFIRLCVNGLILVSPSAAN